MKNLGGVLALIALSATAVSARAVAGDKVVVARNPYPIGQYDYARHIRELT